jgi:hypothetical protein
MMQVHRNGAVNTKHRGKAKNGPVTVEQRNPRVVSAVLEITGGDFTHFRVEWKNLRRVILIDRRGYATVSHGA